MGADRQQDESRRRHFHTLPAYGASHDAMCPERMAD